MNGRLIVFEGVEGSGKTTQLKRSYQWLLESGWCERLQARDVLRRLIITREPGGTEVGREIRQLLLTPPPQEPLWDQAELLLYAADRAQHIQQMLKPELTAGSLILCDRYTDSTIAYQGYGRGLSLELIDQLNQIATDGLQSDLTLWLDVDAAEGLTRTRNRGEGDRLEKADLSFHQRVQQGFNALAISFPERIIRIDASFSEIEVTQQIQEILTEKLTQWYES
ncbi:MAG: dTMP kinase [Scytolyngbya sp. HA4215-MV1]|jgi:dTMP kinase|nr:dTMP kinase [Scytolyngbya sp. HA4215-MV1]